MKKLIFILFAVLLFLVPLILWPFTSEVFEFNKMVLVYILTAAIAGTWLSNCITEKKFLFRRTILDVPLLIFIGSQFFSTILSIDPLTSALGYYSRFNGGLVSTLCYSLLYWAFVSNFEKKDVLNLINYSLLPSAGLVALYGVAEHFGIDKSIWVQDVQSRVFSTLGQPNWLAAWLVALLPLTWTFIFRSSIKKPSFWVYFSLSVLFFWTLIFTKSRSGLLGLGAAALIFGGLTIWKESKNIKKILVPSGYIIISILVIAAVSGTELTPSLTQIVRHESSTAPAPAQGTALETGGTESGTIRQIVWKGAVQIWLHYPVFGTGVETFAFSYYRYRPAEHNLTSEWDFIYNKAHNEFLNMAANTGTVGLLAYLILIGASILIFVKKLEFPISIFQFPIKSKSKKSQIENLRLTGDWKLETGNLNIALLAGYVSLSVTNFFGFSVVPTQLQFFLFPAFAFALGNSQPPATGNQLKKLSGSQKFLTLIVAGCMLLVIFAACKYWYADTLYNKGQSYNKIQKPDLALPYLSSTAALEPNQALYASELANSYATIALAYYQQKDAGKTKEATDLAIAESDKAISLSPANVNLKRSRFGVFIMLSTIDPNYLINARDTLIDAINYAPTDAKLSYNLGLTYARTGQTGLALETLKKTVELKADYGDARLAYAILLIDNKQNAEARAQLEYILTKIDSTNSLAKQTLESIR